MDKFHRPMVNVEDNSDIIKLEQLSGKELTHYISNNKKRYQVNDGFLLREVGDEYLLIPIGNSIDSINGMISLNETFCFIWKQFQSPHTIYEVILTAKEEYDDETGRMEKDIYRFVLESIKLGFIKEVK